MHHNRDRSKYRNMASLKLAFLVIYFLWAWGSVLSQGVEERSEEVSSSLVREPRGFIKRRLCRRYGIGCEQHGGFGGYPGGGYPGQIPAINIGISQSQSSASNGIGGGYNGYYPNNYQYNQGYPGYGGYNQGYGGYGGYGQRPGYGNGNGGSNNQFNGNYYGGNGGGYGFQGGPYGFDEYADDINGGSGAQNDAASAGSTDINGAPINNNDQGQSDYAEAGYYAYAGRNKN